MNETLTTYEDNDMCLLTVEEDDNHAIFSVIKEEYGTLLNEKFKVKHFISGEIGAVKFRKRTNSNFLFQHSGRGHATQNDTDKMQQMIDYVQKKYVTDNE